MAEHAKLDWRDHVTRIVERHTEAKRLPHACIYLYGPRGVGKTHLMRTLEESFPDTFYGLCLNQYNAAELRAVVTQRQPRSLTVLMSNFPPESRAGVRRIPEIMGPVTVVHADTGPK